MDALQSGPRSAWHHLLSPRPLGIATYEGASFATLPGDRSADPVEPTKPPRPETPRPAPAEPEVEPHRQEPEVEPPSPSPEVRPQEPRPEVKPTDPSPRPSQPGRGPTRLAAATAVGE